MLPLPKTTRPGLAVYSKGCILGVGVREWLVVLGDEKGAGGHRCLQEGPFSRHFVKVPELRSVVMGVEVSRGSPSSGIGICVDVWYRGICGTLRRRDRCKLECRDIVVVCWLTLLLVSRE